MELVEKILFCGYIMILFCKINFGKIKCEVLVIKKLLCDYDCWMCCF